MINVTLAHNITEADQARLRIVVKEYGFNSATEYLQACADYISYVTNQSGGTTITLSDWLYQLRFDRDRYRFNIDVDIKE